MIGTYSSSAEAEADRAQQMRMIGALGAWTRALRKDECNAWCISGKRGKVYTWGDNRAWLLSVQCRSKRVTTRTLV